MTHFRRIQANQRKRAVSVGAAVLILIGLSACATAPMSPSLVTLPGTGRSFDQFRADDYNCRLYGEVQIGLRTPQSAAAAAMTVGTASGAGLVSAIAVSTIIAGKPGAANAALFAAQLLAADNAALRDTLSARRSAKATEALSRPLAAPNAIDFIPPAT